MRTIEIIFFVAGCLTPIIVSATCRNVEKLIYKYRAAQHLRREVLSAQTMRRIADLAWREGYWAAAEVSKFDSIKAAQNYAERTYPDPEPLTSIKMNPTINDGGPAFSRPFVAGIDRGWTGMSLRAYLYAAALSGYNANPELTRTESEIISSWAIQDADAGVRALTGPGNAS